MPSAHLPGKRSKDFVSSSQGEHASDGVVGVAGKPRAIANSSTKWNIAKWKLPDGKADEVRAVADANRRLLLEAVALNPSAKNGGGGGGGSSLSSTAQSTYIDHTQAKQKPLVSGLLRTSADLQACAERMLG